MSTLVVTNITDSAGVNLLTPPGVVLFFAASTAPSGWLKCNGASLSTTTYATLFANIGYTFGGSGSTLNVPDLRGEFIRGWDDGRGIDISRAFGSAQTDTMQGHIHQLGAGEGSGTDGSAGDTNIDPGTGSSGQVYPTSAPLTDGTNGSPRTSSETRPRNISLLACIKYQ